MIVVYVGPTISSEEVTSILDCRCLPPVSHGDILQLDLENISAIGIIDGYFEGAPSVWHKEILYAMDQGVHVYGAASMGALRAAELHSFGMQGVGTIFEWYRDLVIEDDDEVAVSHGPVESDYMVASEPMVNIRKTLQLALEAEVISQNDFTALINRAKGTFYKQRNWGALLSGARWEVLLDWVKTNRVDLKKEDALAMTTKLVSDQSKFDQALRTNYLFEWTNVWDAAFCSIRGDASPFLSVPDRLVLEQIKLEPAVYLAIEEQVLSRWLSNNPDKVEAGAEAKEALKAFRAKNGLTMHAELLAYMQQVDLSETDLVSQMEREGSIMAARKLSGDLSGEIISALHQDNKYAELLQIAMAKEDALQQAEISVSASKVKRGSYLIWYFERILGVEVPYDIAAYATANGFTGVAEFDRILLKEYLYQEHLSNK